MCIRDRYLGEPAGRRRFSEIWPRALLCRPAPSESESWAARTRRLGTSTLRSLGVRLVRPVVGSPPTPTPCLVVLPSLRRRNGRRGGAAPRRAGGVEERRRGGPVARRRGGAAPRHRPS